MYRSIVVPLDGSPFAEQAVASALMIAEASGAKVTLVRAWNPASYRYTSELTPPVLNPEAEDHLAAINYLETMASRLRQATTVTIDVAVVPGPPAEAIKECLSTTGAGLVVMTTHGLAGWSRAWIGSGADALDRIATTPVLLCRPLETPTATTPGRFSRVMIPLDGSAEGEEILPHAAELRAGSDIRFILLRVVRPVMAPVHPYTYAMPAWQADQTATEQMVARARDYLTTTADWLKERCPKATVDVDVRLAERAGAAIVDAARDYAIDLVALTTHARRGVRLVLGSVADKVLRGTHGSVLLVHPTADQRTARETEGALAGAVFGKVF